MGYLGLYHKIAFMKKSVWQQKYQLLSKELKSLRVQSGLTQAQLSEKLSKPQSYVSKYESGERYLDFIEVLAICDALSVNPNDLISKMGFFRYDAS